MLSLAGRRTSGGWIGSMIASWFPIAPFQCVIDPTIPRSTPILGNAPLRERVIFELSQLAGSAILAPE
jgi:hypothetical protein